MNHENWEEFYRLAALEVDGGKMPERISAAREAIAGRLQQMDGASDHRDSVSEQDGLMAHEHEF